MSSGAGGTIIDSLWIALGIRPDTSGLKKVRDRVNEAKESLLSVGTAVKAFVAGFAIKEIADIGSTFEQNRIQIAGFLSALGQSSDFNQGLLDASDVIQQITKDAAILPGEAQEYIEVFKAGLPFVQGAMPGGSLGDITKFTNQLTAIGKTFGLDAGLIAREFDHMLSPGKGMASLRLPLFRQLLTFMPKMANGARVTAESFNAMTAPQRLQLLQATFEKLQPMLDASANSFDAMWGAAKSAFKQVTRLATDPLFKGMKKALDQINSALYTQQGKLTPFGQNIVDGVTTATKYLTQMLAAGGKLIMWFSKSKVGAMAFKTVLTLVGTALAGLAVQKTIGSFMSLFRVLTNLKALMTGGLFLAIALIAEDLYQFYTGGDSVTGLLAKRFPDAFAEAGMVVRSLWETLKELGTALGMIGDVLMIAASNSDILAAALVALAAIFAPQATLFAGAWALGRQIGELIIQFTKLIGLAHQLGFLAEEPEALKNFKSPSHFDRNARVGDEPTFLQKKAPAWQPWTPGASVGWTPGDMAAASAVGPSVTTVHQANRTTINIKSTDPKAAGREVQRALTRNAQTGVKY